MDDGRERPGAQPALGLLVDRLPRGEVVRQHPPFRPCAHDPAQGVEDLAQVVVAPGSVEAHQGQVREDELPLGIGDIGRIGLALSTHAASVRLQVHNRL